MYVYLNTLGFTDYFYIVGKYFLIYLTVLALFLLLTSTCNGQTDFVIYRCLYDQLFMLSYNESKYSTEEDHLISVPKRL